MNGVLRCFLVVAEIFEVDHRRGVFGGDIDDPPGSGVGHLLGVPGPLPAALPDRSEVALL